MKRYYSYKPSGIFWVSKIPTHWHINKLKYVLTKLDRERLPNSELLICSNSGNVTLRGDTKLGLVSSTNDIYQGVKSGDLLIHGMDTWHGAVGISQYDGMCTPVVHVCNSTQNKQWVYYYIRFMAQSKVFKLISNGVRQNTSDFRSWDKFAAIPILLPPLSEQEKIVEFLTSKTSHIDAQVTERERELQLLNELKQAEIANIVTHGLNPDVPMKDSGIPWIGQIPEHWEVMRMKRIFSESQEKTDVDGGQLLSLSQYTGVTPKIEGQKVGMFEAETTVGYNVVHPGQFVMNIMLAWNGSYAVSDYEGVISPAYSVFNFEIECKKKYFHYLLRMQSYSGAFKTMSKGIIDSRLRLYPTYFFQFPCIVPPLNEQRAIVEYIENKVKGIDDMVANLQAEIDYLKEYKQRLIADCVTGQVKVE